MNHLAQKIEALLFYEGGTLSKKTLRDALTRDGQVCDEGAFVQALLALKDGFAGRGMQLYESATDVSLRPSPEMAAFLAEYEKKSLSEDVGSAAIEVLAVLLYRGPSTQAEIESIRGVNSAFTLRTLRMRGLITKDEVEEEGKTLRNVYSLTADALAHLGVTHESGISEREDIRAKLKAFEDRAAADLARA